MRIFVYALFAYACGAATGWGIEHHYLMFAGGMATVAFVWALITVDEFIG